MNEPIYNLKVEESKKTKEWYKDIAEYLVPFNNTAVSDYNKMRAAYGLLNNDTTIFKEALEALCRPGGNIFYTPFEIDDEPAFYNRLYPKVMYTVGEMLKRNEGFDVLINSEAMNYIKNDELRENLIKSVEEWMLIQMEMADMKRQGASPIDMSRYYEQMRSYPEPEEIASTDYKNELEEFLEHVIQYCEHKFDIKRKRVMTCKHALTTDRMFAGVVERFGKPEPFVFNPLHFGFHKSPNQEDVEKGAYWWYREAVTYAEAYNELKDHPDVSQEDIEKIATYVGYSQNRPNSAWDIKSGKARFQPDYSYVEGARESMDVFEKHVGQSMGTGTNWRYHTERLIWKTYIQFMAFKKVMFLTTINERGKQVVEVVPDNYPIPEDSTRSTEEKNGYKSKVYEWIDDFGYPAKAEILWVPRRYEVTRWGSDIYTDFRECRYQPFSIDAPFDFELSAKGGFFSSLNAEPISYVERAAPALMQYIFIKQLQNKELAKYEGYIKNIDASQIPDYLTQDENGEPLYEGVDKLSIWRYYRRTFGESFSDSNQSGIMPNYQQTRAVTPEVSGSIAEILNMQNLLDLIDREMGLLMMVPPQAEGIFDQYSNATDNQQALQQGYTMAEEFFHRHNHIWQKVMGEYVTQFVHYYRRYFEENPDKEEVYLNYINSENARMTVKVTPKFLEFEDLGVFVRDTTSSDQYRRFMLQYLQPIAQNAGEGVEIISNIIMSITRGESPVTIHKKIATAARNQQERMKQVQEMQSKLEEFKSEQEFEKMQLEHQFKIDEIDTTKAHDKEIKAMDIFKFTQDKDEDADEIPDYIEAMRVVRQLNQKDREIDIKEKELDIKRKMANKKSDN